MTRNAITLMSSGMTGLTLPGMIDEPGCRSGKLISARPARGPEANKIKSPAIFDILIATLFNADDLKSETKFSFGLGAGVKYFRWQTIGLRAHVRYTPTMLNDEDAADFCDPFGFCQSTLQQVEFAGGAVIRF